MEEKRGKHGALVTRFHYNAQNQLVKVDKGGHTFAYAYDALGRRVRKQDTFGDTKFMWNGDVLLSERRQHIEKIYLYEPGSFRPLAFIENNQCYFYQLDHLGTPQEQYDRYKTYRSQGLSAEDAAKISKTKPDFYVGPAGPSATVPSTAYRYERYLNDDGTEYAWGQHMINNKEGQVTYFGFEKYDTGLEAGEAFQVKQLRHTNPLDPSDTSWSDTRIRGEFDTLQLFDQNGNLNARTPRAFGDKLGAPSETFTEAYPQYGVGGAQQVHADRAVIKFDKVDVLPEK